MKQKINIIPVLVIVVALLIAGCISYTQKNSGTNTPPAAPVEPSAPATPTAPSTPTTPNPTVTIQTKEFTIEGSEFKFSPDTIQVSKGDKVKITFKNTGNFPHNLIIDELNVATKTINPGQTNTVEFTVGKTGTFAFYCGVDEHRRKGMEGQIEI